MSTVNKARVWVILPTIRQAAFVALALDRKRLAPRANGLPCRVEFFVPKGMTLQDAIITMAKVTPPGTEIYAS